MEHTAATASTSSTAFSATHSQELTAIALTMRIPKFWRDKPRLWFLQFEAATADSHRSQTQLAQMIVAQLEKGDIEQISDILFDPPKDEKIYEALKKRLIAVYEESDNKQFQKLLSEMELGDQKPSQLLRKMKNLARDKVPDSTLRLMWTNHLPAHVRSVLAVSETFKTQTALDELALLADKMIETNSPQITAVTDFIQPPPLQDTNTRYLIEEIRKLTLQIAAIKVEQQTLNNNFINHQRGRSTNRNNNNNNNRSRSNTPTPYCFYHRRFGAQARRCTTPCTYKHENSSKSEN